MDSMERHEMKLETMHPTGAQEWVCPTCGHRLAIRLQPRFEITVLLQGDDFVEHVGKGDWRIPRDGSEVIPIENYNIEDDEISEDSLRLWVDLLREIDFSGWDESAL